jgi:hypothetical protein
VRNTYHFSCYLVRLFDDHIVFVSIKVSLVVLFGSFLKYAYLCEINQDYGLGFLYCNSIGFVIPFYFTCSKRLNLLICRLIDNYVNFMTLMTERIRSCDLLDQLYLESIWDCV